MVHIVLDVVLRAANRALALIDLVGSLSTHVTVHIKQMVAHCAPRVARVTEFLIVGYGTLGTLASQEQSIFTCRGEGSKLGRACILYKEVGGVAKVAVVSILGRITVSTSIVTLFACAGYCIEVISKVFTGRKAVIGCGRNSSGLLNVAKLALSVSLLSALARLVAN
jgi:hypothetical protein